MSPKALRNMASFKAEAHFMRVNPMNTPSELLAQEILRLPRAERAALLDRVIASLDSDALRDAEWDKIAAERDAEAEANPAVLEDGNTVIARLRAELT